MRLSKQQVFDICTAILLAAILLVVAALVAVDSTDKPCKHISRYKNTLQHDIHGEWKCQDK